MIKIEENKEPKAGEPGHWRYNKDKNTKTGTTTTKTMEDSGLSKKEKKRVEDFADDIKDDGKRNYSNRKKKK